MTALARKYADNRRADWTGFPDAVAVEQVASGTAERELAEGWSGPGRLRRAYGLGQPRIADVVSGGLVG